MEEAELCLCEGVAGGVVRPSVWKGLSVVEAGVASGFDAGLTLTLGTGWQGSTVMVLVCLRFSTCQCFSVSRLCGVLWFALCGLGAAGIGQGSWNVD